MRFELKTIPSYGDQRIITKFAWFPIEIKREVRWLERVTILQMYENDWDGYHWVNICFVDEEKEINNEKDNNLS